MTTLTILLDGTIVAQEVVPRRGFEPSEDLLEEVRDAIITAIRNHEGGKVVTSCEIRVTI